MAFLDRYDIDVSRPTPGQAWRDLARRTLAPALALWVAIVAIGLLIVGPLDELPGEEEINTALQDGRSPALDNLTSLFGNVGDTAFTVIMAALVIALLLWRTRRWWFAVVPAIALSVQSTVFVTAAFVVGRERPTVEHLDDAPPTSSFPSGHVGASTAFYLTMALIAQRITQPVLRRAVTAACFLVPLLVAYARLYRGMHHLSDVVVGLVNGILCAWLAWRYLRRDEEKAPDAAPGPQGPARSSTRTATS